jgi:DUF1680 family protein
MKTQNNKILFRSLLAILFVIVFQIVSFSQDKLYTNEFSLSEVKLLDGPFKSAMDLNITTILKYDLDRLLAPYLKSAGLTPKGTSYSNWIDLDGHIGGHYLSALAMAYSATGNATCKSRMDYMISELKRCQDANASNTTFVGYVGGVPDGKTFWTRIKNGDLGAVWDYWVPWYNVHKTYAGLRDAWIYGNNSDAKTMFLKFCDWGINLCAGLSDSQMQSMLGNEHGGINEIYADAYQMTGDAKYMTMAKRLSHNTLLTPMSQKIDNLDNLHANTQVPKVVGFQRIAELAKDNTYYTAAEFFWETVTTKRSLALGGNSREEHFPSAAECSEYTTVREGPESCNTNNMLKLTEGLFRMKPDAKYADYFERAMFNHILSTQHPTHGGYVYFTPARPRHYRVYSAPNQAMWCCVGTGMENHMKYGEFIYTHKNDSLYVNLFVASQLNWTAKGVSLKQETTFPNEEQTKITITSATNSFKLFIRHPSWVPAGKLKIAVGTDTLTLNSQPSTYVQVDRALKVGDVVTVILPMHCATEPMINVPDYLAINYGPILLGAKTGTENLSGLVAGEGRWEHIAGGSLLALDQAPMIVSDKASVASKIVPVKNQAMTFKLPVYYNSKMDSITLSPFYKIHDARYMMYWMTVPEDQYKQILDSLAIVEKQKLILDQRTIDKVTPGEQQPEVDHNMIAGNSEKGIYQDASYRHVLNGSFSYELFTNNELDLSLLVRYWGNETGNRTFNILIDGELLVTENIFGKWNVNEFENVEYKIPNSMITGKTYITVTFSSSNDNYAGGVYDVRLLRATVPQLPYGGTAWSIPGTIQFENYDIGGNSLAYNDASTGNTGGAIFRTDEDVDLENCTDADAGYNIGYATAGEWLEYTVNVTNAGKYNITFRAACNGDDRTISLETDGESIANNIAIPNTGGWQIWEDVTVENVTLEAGIQVFRITIGATDYVNLNYLNVISNSTPPKVQIISPIDNREFTTNDDIEIMVNASATDATVEDVTISVNGNLMITDNAAPYAYTLPKQTEGTYEIIAEVTDSKGSKATNSVTIVVSTAPVVIQLKKGWNMVGYPLPGSAPFVDALSSIINNILAIKDYDGFYDVNGSINLNTLTHLFYGEGYYIKVDKDCELTW